MYMVLTQIFKLAHGLIAGLMSLSLPGSWGAYAGLSSLAGFKVLSATITTIVPVKIDKFGAWGQAISDWMEAAATACMVALQRYYTQVCCPSSLWGASFGLRCQIHYARLHNGLQLQDAEATSNIYLQTLQNGGFAAGTEGKLQLAVLIFSVLAVLSNLFCIWGFIVLRILGLLYVQQEVCNPAINHSYTLLQPACCMQSEIDFQCSNHSSCEQRHRRCMETTVQSTWRTCCRWLQSRLAPETHQNPGQWPSMTCCSST